MQKRGQLTIFIILGIIILGTVLGAVYLSGELKKRGLEAEGEKVMEGEEAAAVKMFVESCLRNTAEEGLVRNGKQGGYYETKGEYTYYFSNVLKVPYYFYENAESLPEIYVFEEELDKYVAKHKEDNCNFSLFEKRGYEIRKTGEFDSETMITDYGVILDIKYPLEIRREGQATEINQFKIEIESRLKLIHNLSKEILKAKKESGGAVCISCLLAYSDEYGLEFEEANNLATGTSYLTIFDKKNKIKGEEYQFRFALKDPVPEKPKGWW